LRKDKLMTRDVFGTYTHTYKFHEGVADGVILDLRYEARDVPQRLTSPREEPHAPGVPPRHDAEAVVLDLVNPAGPCRWLFRRSGQARFDDVA
jgi:hypothetical protein